jgi:hypothetical protein
MVQRWTSMTLRRGLHGGRSPIKRVALPPLPVRDVIVMNLHPARSATDRRRATELIWHWSFPDGADTTGDSPAFFSRCETSYHSAPGGLNRRRSGTEEYAGQSSPSPSDNWLVTNRDARETKANEPRSCRTSIDNLIDTYRRQAWRINRRTRVVY